MLDHRSPLLIDTLHVIANFARFDDVRQKLIEFQVVELCSALLDANSSELSFICCGLLVNFSIDVQSRPSIIETGAINK